MVQQNMGLNEHTENVILKKRGRKSKKELELAKCKYNIIVTIEEKKCINEIVKNDIKNDMIPDIILDINPEMNNVIYADCVNEENCEQKKTCAKKRGRKPKGGKIIQQIVPLNNNKEDKPNIILHLKCSLKDLQTNTLLTSTIDCFNFNSTAELPYEVITSNNSNSNNNNGNSNNNDIINTKKFISSTAVNNVIADNNYDNAENECLFDSDDKQNKENDIKDIWKKLKQLEHNLHINNISDKKSACFWCTYEFDNPPVYIPKHYIKDTYHVYGCFCSPECSTAYLMEENIDSSSKFERYHLINHIYSKIFDYKKNIKPAPNPYYMLDKYYGNLTIQEYRALLRNERLFLVVDKPLTRILPELHEDNDDFIINNKIIPSNTYQIKKKLQKKQQTKSNILTEKFGLTH
jgi:hypothetical protein